MVEIRPDDILLGRGPFCYRNPGNIAFRNLIQKYVEGYERDSPRSVKQKVVKKLILKAQNQGRRFLVRSMDSDTWFEAHSYLVHTKVSHALRDARNSAKDMSVSTKSSVSVQRSTGTKNQKKKELTSKLCQDLHQEQASIEGEINTSIQNTNQMVSLIFQDSPLYPAQPQVHILNFCNFLPAWSNIPENPNHQSQSCSYFYNPMNKVHFFTPILRNAIPYRIPAMGDAINPMEIQTAACVIAPPNFKCRPPPHANVHEPPSESVKNKKDNFISPETSISKAFDTELCKEDNQVSTAIWCQGPRQLL